MEIGRGRTRAGKRERDRLQRDNGGRKEGRVGGQEGETMVRRGKGRKGGAERQWGKRREGLEVRRDNQGLA